MALDHFRGNVMQQVLTQPENTLARAERAREMRRHSAGATRSQRPWRRSRKAPLASGFRTLVPTSEEWANRRFTSKRAPGREWRARSFAPLAALPHGTAVGSECRGNL